MCEGDQVLQLKVLSVKVENYDHQMRASGKSLHLKLPDKTPYVLKSLLCV